MAKKSVKLDIGTIYRKEEGGVYYFRYQINGERKAVSLKTRNLEEAKKEAKKQLPILQATTTEVIAAHVQHARGLSIPQKNLLLTQAWTEYERSPERATPATISEALSYKTTFEEFVSWVNEPNKTLREVTAADADAFAHYMRNLNIANSDKQNARIESERALSKVMFGVMADDMELYKQFTDSPSFTKWLSDMVFSVTYNTEGRPSAQDVVANR